MGGQETHHSVLCAGFYHRSWFIEFGAAISQSQYEALVKDKYNSLSAVLCINGFKIDK